MTVYDKNLKRIKEIERALEKGKIDPVRAHARIMRIKAKGPEFWVKGYAYGKHYDEKVEDSGSIKAARSYDMRVKVQVEDRTYTPAELMKAKLRDIFKAHLKAQEGKGGFKAARTRCGHASRAFGHITLDKLHSSPAPLLEAGFETMPEEWTPKSRWHVWSFMKASIEGYKKANPKIQINNPMTAYPMSHGTAKRTQAPTLADHLAILSHVRNNPARWVTREGKGPSKAGYPAYLYPLLVIKAEQGLRGMEIIPWRFERADLDAKRPAVMTRILKKDGAKADQWVVLTPASFKALSEYLETVKGPKEYGKIWPVKNWPTALMRRVLDECSLPDLVPHDYRRFWTMKHIDKSQDRRKAAVGRESDDSEEFYKHFNRQEQEAFYAEEWAEYEAGN